MIGFKMDTLSITSLSNEIKIPMNIRDKLKQILTFLKEKREDLLILKARYDCLRTTWEAKEVKWEEERKALQEQIDVLQANAQDGRLQLHVEVQKNLELDSKVQMLEEQLADLNAANLSLISDLDESRKIESETSSKFGKVQYTLKRAQAEKCVMLRKCMDLEARQRELELWNSKLSEYGSRVHGHNQALHQECERLFSVLGRLRLDNTDGDVTELEEIRCCVETLSKEQESEPPEKEEVPSEQMDDNIEIPETEGEEGLVEEEPVQNMTLAEILEAINSTSDDQRIECPELQMKLSVSQVFLRVHALTLQKNALVEDLERYKVLNTQLQKKVKDHEQKILNVKTELQTMWGLVSRLRKQHDQLHTSELIHKYDLQEKRLLLNRLKEELEYSREQWKTLQQKNKASAQEWKSMREEFARRKQVDSVEDASQSTEDSTCQSPTGDSATPLDSDGAEDGAEHGSMDQNSPLVCYALISYDNPGLHHHYL